MGRSLSPIVQRELANLDKDAESRRTAMKTLTTYAKDLDSEGIPQFLAQVSKTKGPTPSSGECTISLFEVLARVHGRNITPQIDMIMTTIIRTLSSSAGSFPLHQACSKVVPAIARYGIDPSTPDPEKMKIISSLCKPLLGVLLDAQESLASGSALCLKSLVESTNWKYAPNDLVNELCLKIACALENKATQSNSHIGLVMALAKHNVLTVEAYARLLIRSGLQILNVGVSDSNSQKRFSAIQMIIFLMKCVDSRSIISELDNIVEIMEKSQADSMPYVRGAAFEALQTAKFITSQKGTKHEISSSPVTGSNFCRKDFNRSPRIDFASPESQTVDSYVQQSAFTDSPPSSGQSSCNHEYISRANRRLWSNNDNDGVDVSFKDGLFLKACSNGFADSELNEEVIKNDVLQSELFSGFVHSRPTNARSRDATPSPQRCRKQLTLDDVKIYTTPRKLVRSLQNHTADTVQEMNESRPTASVNSYIVKFSPVVKDLKDAEDEEKREDEAASINESSESGSTDNTPKMSIAKKSEEPKVKTLEVHSKNTEKIRYRKAMISLAWSIILVIIAIVVSTMRNDEEEEDIFYVVPT